MLKSKIKSVPNPRVQDKVRMEKSTPKSKSQDKVRMEKGLELVLNGLSEEDYTYVQQRRVFALALMYVTGKGPADILNIQKQDVLLLLEGGSITV